MAHLANLLVGNSIFSMVYFLKIYHGNIHIVYVYMFLSNVNNVIFNVIHVFHTYLLWDSVGRCTMDVG